MQSLAIEGYTAQKKPGDPAVHLSERECAPRMRGVNGICPVA